VGATIAQAVVDPTLEGRAVPDASRSAVTNGRGYLSWGVNHVVCVVFLHHPDEETSYEHALEKALSWCLVLFIAPEIGIGQELPSC
jgi:hypothetical protein